MSLSRRWSSDGCFPGTMLKTICAAVYSGNRHRLSRPPPRPWRTHIRRAFMALVCDTATRGHMHQCAPTTKDQRCAAVLRLKHFAQAKVVFLRLSSIVEDDVFARGQREQHSCGVSTPNQRLCLAPKRAHQQCKASM